MNNIDTPAGSAFLGTYQTIREKAVSADLVGTIDLTEPMVAQRLAAGGASVPRVIGDPRLRSAEGAALLSQATTREATVLAYDDVFRLVALQAAATTLHLLFILWRPGFASAGRRW